MISFLVVTVSLDFLVSNEMEPQQFLVVPEKVQKTMITVIFHLQDVSLLSETMEPQSVHIHFKSVREIVTGTVTVK